MRYQLFNYNTQTRYDVKSKHWENPNETELKIEQWLNANHVAVSITGGYPTKRDSWECDQWRVSIWPGNGAVVRERGFIFETDYNTGIGHREYSNVARMEVKRATAGLKPGSIGYKNAIRNIPKTAQTPHVASVLHCIVLDAFSAMDSFSDWCDNFGYSSDSIKALNTYQTCEKIKRDLLKVLSMQQLQELQELLQDY